MDMEDVDKLLEEAAQMADRKMEDERAKRSGTETSSRPPSRRSNESRRRSRSPRRNRERDRDEYRRRDDDDKYRPRGGGRRRSVSPADDYYRPARRDDRDRDRESSRDRGSRRDRDHDRDRGDRHRDRDDRESRAERGDRRDRDRERDRGDDRRRSDGRGRDSGRKTKTPELNDDERDSRTVFVQQLAARLRTKELGAFFASCGTVKEAQIVKDRVSGRSKG